MAKVRMVHHVLDRFTSSGLYDMGWKDAYAVIHRNGVWHALTGEIQSNWTSDDHGIFFADDMPIGIFKTEHEAVQFIQDVASERWACEGYCNNGSMPLYL